MKHKTIQQLRDNLKRVLKRGSPKQMKKLRKAYHGKSLKKWWSDYANADGYNTIAELKDFEGVGHRMKGGKRHNHVRNATARMRKCKECGDPIVKGMEARIEMPLVRGRDNTMCRCCLRMLEEEIYHHNYQTVKEIEMMEADLYE